MLLYKSLFAVDDVDTLCRVCNLAALEVVDSFHIPVLTMPSFRNPSGITKGYTSLDKMLPALSKLGVL